MATIEERARELGHKFARQYHHNCCFLEKDKSFVYSNDEITDACIEMATDQRKIDVEKACKWLRAHLPRVLDRYYPDSKDKCDTDVLNEDMREDFYKAMMED